MATPAPFEFTCEHGRFRICDERCEQHQATHWVRIDQGDPNQINPIIDPSLKQRIKHWLTQQRESHFWLTMLVLPAAFGAAVWAS